MFHKRGSEMLQRLMFQRRSRKWLSHTGTCSIERVVRGLQIISLPDLNQIDKVTGASLKIGNLSVSLYDVLITANKVTEGFEKKAGCFSLPDIVIGSYTTVLDWSIKDLEEDFKLGELLTEVRDVLINIQNLDLDNADSSYVERRLFKGLVCVEEVIRLLLIKIRGD